MPQYPEFTSGLLRCWRSAEKIYHNNISDHFILKYDKWHASVLHKIISQSAGSNKFPSLIYRVNSTGRFHIFTYMALACRKKMSKLSVMYVYIYFCIAGQGASQRSQKHTAYRDGYLSHSMETRSVITPSKLLGLGSIFAHTSQGLPRLTVWTNT